MAKRIVLITFVAVLALIAAAPIGYARTKRDR